MTTSKKQTEVNKKRPEFNERKTTKTQERMEMLKAIMHGAASPHEKLLLLELCRRNGTSATLVELSRDLKIGIGDLDRARRSLVAKGLCFSPDNNGVGIDVDRHEELTDLLQPLTDFSYRAYHVRAPPRLSIEERQRDRGLDDYQAKRAREVESRAAAESDSVSALEFLIP